MDAAGARDEVVLAHCTCMTGLGEACSHIGATLFYLETTVKHRSDIACTDKENRWLSAYWKKLVCFFFHCESALRVYKIKKRCLDEVQSCTAKVLRTSKPIQYRPTGDQWEIFEAYAANTKPAYLLLVDEYADTYVPTAAKYRNTVFSNYTKMSPSLHWTTSKQSMIR